MNILIPHTWLLDHLETDATPQEIQKYLSLCGPSVERIYDKEGEPVYDMEVTTNRVDMMSILGIAREAAVILPRFGLSAKLKSVSYPTPTVSGQTLPLPKISNDPELCQRIHCVILSQVKHSPTPEWMAKRLRQIDQNVHDSVIDITNYVTHELGHPCHAFDYDKIMQLGGEIKVVTAKPGLPFVTLDGVEYTTVGGEVVFVNPAGDIIDLPAIKGTLNSSIDDNTTNVLFWIESVTAKKVRFASMTHAIRTVAAQLNEKNVDPTFAEPTLKKAVELYQELCQAQVASDVYDEFPDQKTPAAVTLKLARLTDYLGIELPTDEVQQILSDLGCQTTLSSSTLSVTPPTFRPDITIGADVVEEIARIYGYHELPSVVMPTAIPLDKPLDTTFEVEEKIKLFLAHLGWQEVYTYSMVSEAIATQSGIALEEHLQLSNPLTDDRVYLRRSLIPSLVELCNNNPARPELSVFELAVVYEPQASDVPKQHLHLSLVSGQEYRTVRGNLEALLGSLFVKKVQLKPQGTATAPFAQTATISAESNNDRTETIGSIGILADGRIAADITLNAAFLSVVNTHPEYQPLPKTAPVIEDLTFTIPVGVAVGDVLQALQTSHPLVKAVVLSDVYQRNFSFRVTYLDPEQNLSAVEVEPVRKQLVSIATKVPGVTLVGSV